MLSRECLSKANYAPGLTVEVNGFISTSHTGKRFAFISQENGVRTLLIDDCQNLRNC